LLKHKQRLRKLWYETRYPAYKTAVNWVAISIRRTTCKKALERWGIRIDNSEVTPQAIWPITKSLIKGNGSKALTVIHAPLGFKFHPLGKANAIADGRSQWPRRLRHEMSSLARTLGSWVWIPLKAWMSVCTYSVCVGSGLATG
jgi:hypothetical protein